MEHQFSQVRRRVPERLGQIFEDELGDRPKGLRPAFSRKHRLRKPLLKHAEQGSADCQRQQSRHHQQVNDCWITRLELLQPIQRLQFPEQQLHFPPQPVQRRDLPRSELIGQIRHVQVVVVGVLVADTDDAKLHRIG